MTASDASESELIDNALGWAGRCFSFRNSVTITDHPWAKTIALQGSDDTAYLKIADAQAGGNALKLVAEKLSPHVPQLLGSEPEYGWYLYADHGGQSIARKADTATKKEILRTYASIQAATLDHADLIDALPETQFEQLFDDLLAFLSAHENDTPRLDGTVLASHFIGPRSARKYFDIFSGAEPLFRELLAKGDTLRRTINHCDLRTANIAQRSDGSYIIFDWDDSRLGPPGLSLHALFSGCCRPYAALMNIQDAPRSEYRDNDLELLQAYMDALCRGEHYEARELADALPAIICGGVFIYLLAFGDYPVSSERSRETIGKNIRRRLSDLMDLAELLSRKSEPAAHKLADAFRRNGRNRRAEQVMKRLSTGETPKSAPNAKNPKDSFAAAIEHSDQDGVFPAIDIGDDEHQNSEISSYNRKLGAALFERHGTLMIRNAIASETIKNCHGDFMANYEAYLQDTKNEGALRVGDKRYMVTTPLSGSFANPHVFASPFVLPILKRALGKHAILGSMTSVLSLPGSADQRMHKDNSALFTDAPELQLPSFSIAMIVPLVALNKVNGATRVVKGSHRRTSDEAKSMPYQDPEVDLGSCFLMDCRLSHQGMANKSDTPRPILSLVYQRSWYRDYQNFQKQDPLIIDEQSFGEIPEHLQHLVGWAVKR